MTNFFQREPFVAGSFYPAEKKDLEGELKNYLEKAPLIKTGGRLQILIVPHAGLVFSGPVAAAGFKQVKNDYSRVILLGISHRAIFDYAAVFPRGAWETPLAKTTVDENLAAKIIEKKAKINADFSPHIEEHSLEMELIFLQMVLKNFQIVPILIGENNKEIVESLAQKIAPQLDDQTLFVVSSDLSHYPPYEIAEKVDRQTVSAILSGKTTVLEKTLAEIEKQNYPNLDTCACGYTAILTALRVAEISTNLEFKEIKYQNSGDVSGEKEAVVGYAAIGGFRV